MIMQKYSNNKNSINLSFLISLILLVLGYFANNMPLFTNENLRMYACMESICDFMGLNKETNDDVFYINTSFDKVAIPYSKTYDIEDSNPHSLGTTTITSRKKLYEFLKLMQGVDYKYLIIDISFTKGYNSNEYIYDSITGDSLSADSLLFAKIQELNRIVIVQPKNDKLINQNLSNKAALAYYRATATSTNFVRYEYFDSIPYIPLAVYNGINKQKIVSHYPFGLHCLKPFAIYTQGNRLCYNSLFLDFNINSSDDSYQGEFENYYSSAYLSDFTHNLGSEYIDAHYINDDSWEEIQLGLKNQCKNKYVIIGNMYEDMHDTYAGMQPGPTILYRAIKALDENKHIVSPITMILLFILYFFITLLILKRKCLFDFIPQFRDSNNGLLHFILDIFTYATVLSLFHLFEYMTGRVSYSFIVPIIVFTFLKAFLILKKEYNMKKTSVMLIISLLSAILMSFTPANTSKDTFKVYYFTSNRIRVNNGSLHKGQILCLRDKLYFPTNNDFMRAKALDNIPYVDRNGKKRIWYSHTWMQISPTPKEKSFNLGWWLKYGITGSMGINNNGFPPNTIYVQGDLSAFEIESPLVNTDEQYYSFTILDGKYKGTYFVAENDDEFPLIWFRKTILEKYFDCNCDQNFICRMEFHNFGEITKTSTITFIYRK